jgi:hypothetical protein
MCLLTHVLSLFQFNHNFLLSYGIFFNQNVFLRVCQVVKMINIICSMCKILILVMGEMLPLQIQYGYSYVAKLSHTEVSASITRDVKV